MNRGRPYTLDCLLTPENYMELFNSPGAAQETSEREKTWLTVEVTDFNSKIAGNPSYQLNKSTENHFEPNDFDNLSIKLEYAKISAERPWLEPQIFRNEAYGVSSRDPHSISNGTLPSEQGYSEQD